MGKLVIKEVYVSDTDLTQVMMMVSTFVRLLPYSLLLSVFYEDGNFLLSLYVFPHLWPTLSTKMRL